MTRLAAVLSVVLVTSQAPPGFGSVSGVVLDAASGQPLGGVLVSVNGQQGTTGTLSDITGAFRLNGVPAGRVRLVAAKVGYVSPSWTPGQRNPESVVVSAGGQVAGVRLMLRRGGTISGTVSSASRSELPGVSVLLFRCIGLDVCDMAHSRRVQSAVTDERGAYRLFGLADGSYFVAVEARLSASSEPIDVPSAGAIRAAKAQLAVDPASTAPLRSDEPQQLMAYPMTYFPGASDSAHAQSVQVRDGEEKGGVNIVALVATAAARISGAVVGIDGQPTQIRLWIVPDQPGPRSALVPMVGFTGLRFSTSSLVPGMYRIGGRVGSELWASDSFMVNGRDLNDVTLQLRPTVSVAAKVVVEQESTAGDLSGVSVVLRRADLPFVTSTLDVTSAVTDRQGALRFDGVIPGRYAVSCSIPAKLRQTLWLKSVVVAGRDVLDSSFEVTETEQPEVIIAFTSKPAEVSGFVLYGNGVPAAEYSAIIFPSDPGLWVTASRRILIDTVSADGAYVFRGIPAGDYFIGVVGVNGLEDVDRDVLVELSKVSHRMILGDGEAKRIDLQVVAAR